MAWISAKVWRARRPALDRSSEQIAPLIALTGGLARPDLLPVEAVLLADAGLVLESEFDHPLVRRAIGFGNAGRLTAGPTGAD